MTSYSSEPHFKVSYCWDSLKTGGRKCWVMIEGDSPGRIIFPTHMHTVVWKWTLSGTLSWSGHLLGLLCHRLSSSISSEAVGTQSSLRILTRLSVSWPLTLTLIDYRSSHTWYSVLAAAGGSRSQVHMPSKSNQAHLRVTSGWTGKYSWLYNGTF